MLWRVISVEDWAEIRRLHLAEGQPIKEIVRRLGVSRNTVRAALRSERPPEYERPPKGSLVDVVEPQIRALLAEFPRMPSTVIAERIDWQHSSSILRSRVAQLRPEYLGVDPADRVSYRPGDVVQCDLWFPEPRIPVAPAQERMLPVLVMTLGFSRFMSAQMIPSRQAGDILAGMWSVISALGKVPKTLVWDRESAIGGTGKVTVPAAAFAGTLATRIRLAPPRDPEFKGMVERANGFLETSFLPGRSFAGPTDFNVQLQGWLARANTRTVRSIDGRPVDLLPVDLAAMIALPTAAPQTGLKYRVRLARDYYVRVDGNDYSVDPRVIGKFIDLTATAAEVVGVCDGNVVARHPRSWAAHQLVTDPAHRTLAQQLRRDLADRDRSRQARQARHHIDGHPVQIRALSDYDALFGVDFDPAIITTTEEAQ